LAEATHFAGNCWRRLGIASLLPVEILLLTLSFEPSRLQTTIA
jgi:hypothetical protein